MKYTFPKMKTHLSFWRHDYKADSGHLHCRGATFIFGAHPLLCPLARMNCNGRCRLAVGGISYVGGGLCSLLKVCLCIWHWNSRVESQSVVVAAEDGHKQKQVSHLYFIIRLFFLFNKQIVLSHKLILKDQFTKITIHNFLTFSPHGIKAYRSFCFICLRSLKTVAATPIMRWRKFGLWCF